ncbi:F0F1 ATP synthase subunit B [Algibacter miyuki]|nr:F0F1 ATP synthase subunit B [Algibacter miyuki]MDN3667702.1 F0F1 ATP synthase subunit B [Algibacter miyuki]
MDQLLHDFSPGLFFMQAIILLILIVLMRKFAWKPILDALQTREDGIQDALDSAENAKLEMQNLQADNQKLLQEARAEREEMLKEAREMKNTMIEDAKSEAEAQANKMIVQAQAAIEGASIAACACTIILFACASASDLASSIIVFFISRASLSISSRSALASCNNFWLSA